MAPPPGRILYEALNIKTQDEFETAINLHVNGLLRRVPGKHVIVPHDIAERLPVCLKVSEFTAYSGSRILRVEIFAPDGRGYSHQDFELE